MTKIVITGGNGDIAKELKEIFKNGNTVLSPNKYELDVTNRKNVSTYFSRVKTDLLINNAGYILPEIIKDGSIEEWIRQININLIGTYLCSKSAIQNGCKQIINIGSSAGTKGKSSWSAYCSSKRAVVSLTESLVEEGILSVCISPGRTKTKMRKKLFPGEEQSTLMTPKEFALEAKKIFGNIQKNKGLDIVVKREENKIVRYYFKKVKTYV